MILLRYQSWLRPVVFLLGICLVFCPTRSKALSCGQIESTKGRVEILRLKGGAAERSNDVRRVMVVNGKNLIDCQDIIVTRESSRAKVRLRGNTLLTLGAHSRVSIEEYAKSSGSPTLLHLTYGKMRTLFQSDEPKEAKDRPQGSPQQGRFKIRTSTAVAGVRGTDFYLSYEPNTKITEQATITGLVQVQQVGSQQEVTVESGHQVVVEQIPEIAKSKSDGNIKKIDPSAIKPLVVQPIAPSVVAEIKQTSVLVMSDKEFSSPESVKILGAPVDWKPPADEVPFDLNDLKEEF